MMKGGGLLAVLGSCGGNLGDIVMYHPMELVSGLLSGNGGPRDPLPPPPPLPPSLAPLTEDAPSCSLRGVGWTMMIVPCGL